MGLPNDRTPDVWMKNPTALPETAPTFHLVNREREGDRVTDTYNLPILEMRVIGSSRTTTVGIFIQTSYYEDP